MGGEDLVISPQTCHSKMTQSYLF